MPPLTDGRQIVFKVFDGNRKLIREGRYQLTHIRTDAELAAAIQNVREYVAAKAGPDIGCLVASEAVVIVWLGRGTVDMTANTLERFPVWLPMNCLKSCWG